jgi:hypothetical protein
MTNLKLKKRAPITEKGKLKHQENEQRTIEPTTKLDY